MTKNEKVALWVSGAIGIVVLIWIIMMRRSVSAPGPSPYGPNQIQISYPGQTPWTGSANGLPTVPTVSTGCNSCSQGSGIFTSLGNMLNSYTSQSKDLFDTYQQQVYASYPDSVAQYFNNPVGATESAQSRAVMRAF